MKKTFYIYLTLAALLFNHTACFSINQRDEEERETVRKEFTLSIFHAIETEIIGNIEIMQASSISVVAEGDDDLVENLIIKVEDQTLKVEFKDGKKYQQWKGRRSPKLTIFVAMPELTKIESEGVGNISMKGEITVDELTIQSEGVGNITAENLTANHIDVTSEGVGNTVLKGTTQSATLRSEGVGNIRAEKLQAQHVKVRSEGVGNVSCYATESADIRSDGIGNVSYYGNPKDTKLNKNGLGKIRAK